MKLIFTDGGARNNGKKDCKAAWAVFFGDGDEMNEAGMVSSEPSNQKAELYAIYSGLKKLEHIPIDPEEEIVFITDSQFSIDCLTKWYKRWDKFGWKTYKGDPVKHAIIIQESIELAKKYKVKFTHINSHKIPPLDKGSEEYKIWYGNFTVDKMATEMMNKSSPSGRTANPLFKGKSLRISWDDNAEAVLESEDSGDDNVVAKKEVKKARKIKDSTKDEKDVGLTINW